MFASIDLVGRVRQICLVIPFCLIGTLWAEKVPDMPGRLASQEELHFIKRADVVYVLPFTSEAPLRRDDKHLRLLGSRARKELKSLLGDQRSWHYGLYMVSAAPGHPSIGVLFRSGREELVLFFNLFTVDATFNGKRESGMLDDAAQTKFEEWKKRYASRELRIK
jgi:hypothetical protein